MSISNVTDIVGPFAISTLPQTLSVSYPFQNQADLIVYDTGTTGAPVYPATILTLNSDYTVTGGGYDTAGNMQPGSIQVVSGGANNVQVGHNIVIVRRPPLTQLTSFLLTGFLTAEMIEQAVDKLTTITQSLRDDVNRSLRVPLVDSTVPEMQKDARAGKFVGFDSSGNVVFAYPSTLVGATTVLGTANEITATTDPVTNIVTLSLPVALVFTGKTVTGGTFNALAFNGPIGQTTPAAGKFTTLVSTQNIPSGFAITQFINSGVGGSVWHQLVGPSGETASILWTPGTAWKFLHNNGADPIIFAPNNVVSLTIDTSGINAPIGQTTPHAGVFTSVAATSGTVANAPLAATDIVNKGYADSAFDAAGAAAAAQAAAIAAAAADATTKANAAQAAAISAAATDATTKANAAQAAAIAASCQRTRNAINVKDYGAVGDGATNDTAAIVAAIAALPSSNAALYFPGGTYLTDTISITSKVGLAVFGDGYGSSRIKHRSGAGQVINCDSTNSYVVLRDLAFDGNGGARVAGQHAVVMDCSYSRVINCEVVNSGEFCIVVASNTAVVDFMVLGCLLHNGYADGINFQGVAQGIIANNIVEFVDDDCIAVGYNGSGNKANGIVVIGNRVSARNDLGTTTGRGIIVLRANDVSIIGNHISDIKQHGIYIFTDDTSGSTNVPAKTVVVGNYITRTCISSGHGIEVAGVIDCTLINNTVTEIAGGNCIELSDYHEVTIIGGVLESRQAHYCRGIHVKSSAGTYAWGNSWVNLVIKDVHINMTNASNNECVYLAPDASVTLDYVLVSNVTSYQTPAGDYIFTNHLGSAAKIVNNTSITGNSISNGGGGLAPTLANNN